MHEPKFRRDTLMNDTHAPGLSVNPHRCLAHGRASSEISRLCRRADALRFLGDNRGGIVLPVTIAGRMHVVTHAYDGGRKPGELIRLTAPARSRVRRQRAYA